MSTILQDTIKLHFKKYEATLGRLYFIKVRERCGLITSKTNELIKHVKSLLQKKYRDEYGEYIVEGIKMVKEAILEKQEISHIIVSENLPESFEFPSAEIVSESVFSYLSDTKTPQGVLAVVKKKPSSEVTGDIVFVLDHVQDPGNVGTIIRSLDATGITDLIVSEGCADVYSPKVVRSTMGGIFRVNIILVNDQKESLEMLKEKGYSTVATSLDTPSLIYEIDFHQKQAIIIGNESQGVSQEILDLADQKVKIPMQGKAESLNAAVAASVIAYEAVRQRLE